MSAFENSGDEKLDLVLAEAARLAAQMRSVSTMSGAEHGDDKELSSPHAPTNTESSKNPEDNTGFQSRLNHQPLSVQTNDENVLERSALHTPVGASVADTTRDIDAAIRASEEMARALQALGAVPSGIDIQSPSSSSPPGDQKGVLKERDHIDETPTDEGVSAPLEQVAEAGSMRPIEELASKETESAFKPEEGCPDAENSKELDNTNVDAPLSRAGGDNASPSVNETEVPDPADATAAIEVEPDGVEESSPPSKHGDSNDGGPSRKDVGDGVQASKSQELRERLRQTEAEFEMLKARKHPSSLEPLKDGEKSTPNAVSSQTEMTWDKIDHARDGDDDYVPLRDYSAAPIKTEYPITGKEIPVKSSTELTWTKLEQPEAGDEDYVPLRGHNVEPSGVKVQGTGVSGGSGRKTATSSSIDHEHVPGTTPLKDYTSMRHLRSPLEVTWEKVNYANQGDEDYVPLKDYSKPPATPSASSTSNSSRGFSPSFLQFGAEDEFEIAVARSRRGNFDSEGPTALELKRQNVKRRKKMARQLRTLLVVLTLVFGACAYYYHYSSSRKTPVKRPHYKSKTSHHSHPPLISSTQHLSNSQSRSRRDNMSRPVPLPPKMKQSVEVKADSRKENASDRNRVDHLSRPDVVKSEHQSNDHVSSTSGFAKPELAADVQDSSIPETVSAEHGDHYHEDSFVGESDIVVFHTIDPRASICYLPFGYLFAEKCNESERPKRLDNLLQSMFQ